MNIFNLFLIDELINVKLMILSNNDLVVNTPMKFY